MNQSHQQFEFLGKVVMEKMVFQGPHRKERIMDQEACFLYQLNAKNVLYSAGQKLRLGSKEAVVMKCGNYISHYLEPDNAEPSEILIIHFYPEVLKKIYTNDLPAFFLQNENSKSPSIEPVILDEVIESYIRSILFYFENPSLVTQDLISLKIKELILLLIRTESNESRIRQIFSNLFDPVQVDFQEVIQANLFEDLRIEELAALAHLSVSTFKRKFKAIYKENPGTYLRNQKIEKAKKLLLATDLRITEICFEAGFGELTHFNRVFKEQVGVSPSRFREGS